MIAAGGLAKGTASGYKTGWNKFCGWLAAYGLYGRRYDADEGLLCLFATYLSYSIRSGTIHNYLYGVRSKYIELGLGNLLYNKLTLQRLLKQLARSEGTSVRKLRRPLTTIMLKLFRPFFDFSLHDDRCI